MLAAHTQHTSNTQSYETPENRIHVLVTFFTILVTTCNSCSHLCIQVSVQYLHFSRGVKSINVYFEFTQHTGCAMWSL